MSETSQRGTALVTGGSRGIGRAIAEKLATEGYRVAVTGRDREKLAEVSASIPGALAINADVASAEDTRAAIRETESQLGPVDVLVNNAGIGGDESGPRPFVEMDPQTWWRVQETNVLGPALYTHALLPGMLGRGRGVIINIGSYIAIRPQAAVTAYASSKAALARFSDCLAAELHGTGVQVFCISPGLVLTDMTRDLDFVKDIPKSEFVSPEVIADRVCRLGSGGFGALSGLFLHVSDDLDELLARAQTLHDEGLYTLRLSGVDGRIP